MKTKFSFSVAVALLLSTLSSRFSTVHAQGTAFTYQGRLNANGSVASGLYDFRFKLYLDPFGNTQVGSSYLTNAISVTSGLFFTTLDFGPGIFTGSNYWLEVDVRTNGTGSYTVLSPFQTLTPTPYAVFANGASNLLGVLPAVQLTGTLPAGVLSGGYGNAVNLTNPANSFAGSGSGLTGVNAALVGGLAASNFWQTTGNAGTTPGPNFVGTTDNQALQLKVNNVVALQISPAPSLPNIVGGLAAFHPTVIRTNVSGAVVAGGMAPNAGVNGHGSGDYHAVYDNDGTIGGGYGNKAGTDDGDSTDAAFATVAGGVFNTAGNYGATVAGGDSNFAAGNRAAVLGGYQNEAGASLSMVGGGLQNVIQTNASCSAVVGGQQNSIGDLYAFIGGGTNNAIQSGATYSVIGGGFVNAIQTYSEAATIGGGYENTIQTNAAESTVGGGVQNTILSDAQASTIAGGFDNTIQNGAAESMIGGGFQNTIQTNASFSTIGGGYTNTIQILVGGSTIGGGVDNTIQTNANYATIGGGYENTIQTVAFYSTIGGGDQNTIAANATGATVPGGRLNLATNLAFAAGNRAKAIHGGAFVWGDSTSADIASASNDSVTMRAAGGYRLFSDSGATVGVSLAPGSGSWSSMSDRNAKENFQSVDAQSVLQAVATMPLTTWNYKAQDKAVRHVGPMAQDFHAAFGVGENDTTICTVDEGGVALAAIQGLNKKVEDRGQRAEGRIQNTEGQVAELKSENAKLQEQVAELRSQFETLRQAVAKSAGPVALNTEEEK